MSKKMTYGVIGGGSWATAIVKMLSENLSEIHWYMRNKSAIEHLRNENHNPNYLSAVEFDPNQLRLTESINDVVNACDIIILAVPSAFFHAEMKNLSVSLSTKIVFSAIKGIVPESHLIISEHLHEHFQVPFNQIGVITGPCHAEEVALERLSYLTVACIKAEGGKVLLLSQKNVVHVF